MTLSEELRAAAQYTALDGVKELLERAAEAVPCWQPIETAPREEVYCDGVHRFGDYILMHWPGALAPTRGRWWQTESGAASNFIADGGHAVFPTHWMPLPSPPVASQGEQA